MKLSDEIINRYIDGELSSAEEAEVKKLLEESPEDYKNFAALRAVHLNLKKITEEKVSAGFTSMVMGNITGLKKQKTDSLFIFSISSVFLILSLIVLGYAAYGIISAYDSGSSFSLYEKSTDIIDTITTALVNFKGTTGFSILGAIFSFTILISGYFFFERQKNMS